MTPGCAGRVLRAAGGGVLPTVTQLFKQAVP